MKYKSFDGEQENNAVCVNESRILYSKLAPLTRVC